MVSTTPSKSVPSTKSPTRKRRVPAVLARLSRIAAVAALVGCGESPAPAPTPTSADADGEVVLARVGDRTISLEQFRSFYADIPVYLQSDNQGEQRARDHIQTLIDMELLQLEGLARGIDQSPRYRSRVRRHDMDRLVGMYLLEVIHVKLTRAEVQKRFADERLSRALRFSQIVASSLDSARKALDDLASGSTFAEAAQMWSIHQESRDQGGDTGRYVNRLDLPERLAEPLFALAEGQISEPIDLGGAYGIFKIVSEVEADDDGERMGLLYQQMFFERSVEQRKALIDSLRQTYGLVLHDDAVEELVRVAGTSAWEEEGLGELVVYSYDGGQITGRDVIESVDPLDRGSLARIGHDEMVERMGRGLVPDTMLLRAAQEAGIHQRPEVAERLRRYREQQLTIQLRVKVLNERITITDDEVRREYEGDRQRYTRSRKITVEEVLVETEAEAEAVLERIRAGESIAQLSRELSIRSQDIRDEDGRITMSLADGRTLGRLVSEANKTPVGQLVGPLHVKPGYTVFRVLSKRKEPATFEQSKRRAWATVNWIKKQKVFDEFLQELRRKYQDRVEVFASGVARAAAG
jgi:parvulin-like peptidyl-prolyl isomerase